MIPSACLSHIGSEFNPRVRTWQWRATLTSLSDNRSSHLYRPPISISLLQTFSWECLTKGNSDVSDTAYSSWWCDCLPINQAANRLTLTGCHWTVAKARRWCGDWKIALPWERTGIDAVIAKTDMHRPISASTASIASCSLILCFHGKASCTTVSMTTHA